ncbi:MAG: hypothetical protein MJE77_21900 [Proteobacteria bacterium]|nr:hypothetical protein [Pseudomonadota bacterium]
MHWFAYVLILVALFAALTVLYIWRSYRAYRRAWSKKHVAEMTGVVWALRAEQLTRYRGDEAMPSSMTTSAGVTMGYAISLSGEGAEQCIRHHLVTESRGFFGQVLAERALAFSLQRLGFSSDRVEFYITAYSFDSFHAIVEMTGQEHNEWAELSLVPLSSEQSAIVEAREYREQLGRPRILVKSPELQSR